MSDVQPNRVITGLTPRPPVRDLTRLQRRNRPEPVEPPEERDEPAAHQPRTKPSRSAAAGRQRPKPVPVSESSEGGRSSITTYLSESARQRARATYRATSHLEGDSSWSDFVETAILAEVERREREHNDGERYVVNPAPLSPGRPLGR